MYLRGQAYLATHQGAEAIEEFQKIAKHRGITIGEAFGALAHLRLAYRVSGYTASARTTHQDFFSKWPAADADLPILKQAREE